ncbi:hypothetical protein T08_7071, partial [Trichinella sp. T8]
MRRRFNNIMEYLNCTEVNCMIDLLTVILKNAELKNATLNPIQLDNAFIYGMICHFISSNCRTDRNPTVVELFDNNDDEIFTQQKQGDAYCDLSQIKNQSVLQKALLKTKKSEEHVQVPLEKALEIAKQLQLYLSESTNEDAYYIMSRLVKAEQCSSRSSSIHVLQMEIRKTNCEWRDVRDWGSDTACKVLDKEKSYTCIWTGENLFGTTDYLCDRLKYSTTDMRRVLLATVKADKASLKIYNPPEFSATISEFAMKKSLMVKLGFTPDALNTDNAWMETLLVQIKDKKKKHIGKVDLKSSTSKGMEWKKIDNERKQSLISTLKSIVGDENLNETSLKIKDSKKDLKTLLKAIKYGSYYGTAISGLVLVGAWITVACTGAVVPVAAALMVFLSFAALALYMLLHS